MSIENNVNKKVGCACGQNPEAKPKLYTMTDNVERRRGPYGIWGWNTFLILNICCSILAGVISLLVLPFVVNDPDFTRPDIADMCQVIFMGVAAIPIVIWAFKKDRRYPVYCAWWLGGNLILDVIINVYRASLGLRLEGGVPLIMTIVWILYLRRSKRIKNTYGSEGMSSGIIPVSSGEESEDLQWVLPVGRSGLAIAAGYLGLFSLIPFVGPVAVVVGILALRDIKRNPKKIGKGRAWFGIVMGTLTSLLILMLFLLIIFMRQSCVELEGGKLNVDKISQNKEMRKLADQCDAYAQCNLGWRYANGDGVEKNMIEAEKWYCKAKEQGNAWFTMA